ncbi:hypothetical protein [Deinococcus xianganensis]|uniref:Uncharacterized protein n=1 Tax=Deinococcus xianganensis TaxID=1507289 RepID=A0A6I4YN70_9DEIO|nr:hypothetical protein [Deinococcus xianganensis]MXV19025.1 hypothetical protein [Deinococcus xianganensis]
MTPEEWATGIHNEADSVLDTGWSQDTRRHLRRRAWLTATVITLGFTVVTLSLMATLNAALIGSLPALPSGITQVFATPLNPAWALVAGLGYLLTRRGFSPVQAAGVLLTAKLLGSVATRLVTLNVPSTFPDGTTILFDILPSPQAFISGPMLVSLILNFVALGAGIGLARIKFPKARTV